MEIKVTGFVEVTLRDKEGNIVAQDSGYNAVTEMSNNILMDAILPRLGTSGDPDSVPDRVVATPLSEPDGMEANATAPYGSFYQGPAGASVNTSAAHAINCIGYIAVGRTSTPTDAEFSNMADTDFHSGNSYGAFSAQGDGNVGSKNVRKIDSITFPSAYSVRFTTQFGTTEGNLSTPIMEIGIWTAGTNVDSDGFVSAQTPTNKNNMRLFARRVLAGDGITKTNDGTLDISYTIEFSAGNP